MNAIIIMYNVFCVFLKATPDPVFRLVTLKHPEENMIRLSNSSNMSVSFYSMQIDKIKSGMPSYEGINKIMNLDIIEFSIDDVQYKIYPMEKILQIKENRTTCLGKFSKISSNSGNIITIKYQNGDFSATGEPYSSFVEFIPSYVFSAKKQYAGIKEHIGFRVTTPILIKETEIKTIGFYQNNAGKNLAAHKQTRSFNHISIFEQAFERIFQDKFKNTAVPSKDFFLKLSNSLEFNKNQFSLNNNYNSITESKKDNKNSIENHENLKNNFNKNNSDISDPNMVKHADNIQDKTIKTEESENERPEEALRKNVI